MKKVVFLLVVGTLSMPGYATAQDETGAYTWENSTELSFVSTGGNASSSILGLKSTLTATGGRSAFKIEVGGIRGETTFRTRTATGSATNFTVDETTNSQLTAENYFARGRSGTIGDGAAPYTGICAVLPNNAENGTDPTIPAVGSPASVPSASVPPEHRTVAESATSKPIP